MFMYSLQKVQMLWSTFSLRGATNLHFQLDESNSPTPHTHPTLPLNPTWLLGLSSSFCVNNDPPKPSIRTLQKSFLGLKFDSPYKVNSPYYFLVFTRATSILELKLAKRNKEIESEIKSNLNIGSYP